jgi:hypothetical protein
MRVARLRAVAIANLRVSRRFVYYPRWCRRGVSAPSTAVDTLEQPDGGHKPISRTAEVQPKSEDQPHAKRIAAELAPSISGCSRRLSLRASMLKSLDAAR